MTKEDTAAELAYVNRRYGQLLERYHQLLKGEAYQELLGIASQALSLLDGCDKGPLTAAAVKDMTVRLERLAPVEGVFHQEVVNESPPG